MDMHGGLHNPTGLLYCGSSEHIMFNPLTGYHYEHTQTRESAAAYCNSDPFLSAATLHNPYSFPSYYPDVKETLKLNGCNGKMKRRRVITYEQRKAANIRERRRMFNLNEAFDLLREAIPTFSYEKRLSRIDTLRLAIMYISFMTDIINSKDPKDIRMPTIGEKTGAKERSRQLTGLSDDDENDGLLEEQLLYEIGN